MEPLSELEMIMHDLRRDGSVTAIHFDGQVPSILFDNYRVTILDGFDVTVAGGKYVYPEEGAVFSLFDLYGQSFVDCTEVEGRIELAIGSTLIGLEKHEAGQGTVRIQKYKWGQLDSPMGPMFVL